MDSKITVALSEENTPILRVKLVTASEDLPDEVLKQFFQKMGHSSSWIRVKRLPYESDQQYPVKRYELCPVQDDEIHNLGKEIILGPAKDEWDFPDNKLEYLAMAMGHLAQEYADVSGRAILIDFGTGVFAPFDPVEKG